MCYWLFGTDGWYWWYYSVYVILDVLVLSMLVVGIYVCDMYADDRWSAQLVTAPSPPRLASRTDSPIFSPPPALLSTRSYNVLLLFKTSQFY